MLFICDTSIFNAVLSRRHTHTHPRCQVTWLVTGVCLQMHGVAAGSSEAVSVVRELELQYYETQLEIHDCRFEILRNEELLLLTQIKSTQRQIKGLKNTHTSFPLTSADFLLSFR